MLKYPGSLFSEVCAVKLRLAILVSTLALTLAGCTKCGSGSASGHAPQSLEGKMLSGKVTSCSGAFAGLEGYRFKTSLLTGQLFKTTSDKNTTESEGDYIYTKLDDHKARLTMTDRSQLHTGEQIEVTLKFTSEKAGTFDSRIVSGATGEENGTFELK
jgi:hypothetical protein